MQTLTGTLTVREREAGLTRETVLTATGDGGIQREYRVGREAQPMDDAARQWWAKAVPRMAEHLTDPLVRARRQFDRGGVDAVLADMERATDNHPRRQRVEALVRLGQPLPAAAHNRLIAVAARIGSGFERRHALQAIAGLMLAEPQQIAWLKAAGSIDGDFELRSAIDTQVSATPPPAVLSAAVQAATRIQVSFERREALNQLLDRPKLGAAGLERVLTSAEAIGSGFERMQVLLRLVERLGQARPLDAVLIDSLRRAGRGLGDHERGQIENALDRLS